MTIRASQLTEIAEAILNYLDRYPDAADTAEGIATWWLPADWEMDVDTVRLALGLLLSERRVQLRRNRDQHVLYSRHAPETGGPSKTAPLEHRVISRIRD